MRAPPPKPTTSTVWAPDVNAARAAVREWHPGRRLGWIRGARYGHRPVRPRDSREFPGMEPGTKMYCFRYVVR